MRSQKHANDNVPCVICREDQSQKTKQQLHRADLYGIIRPYHDNFRNDGTLEHHYKTKIVKIYILFIISINSLVIDHINLLKIYLFIS